MDGTAGKDAAIGGAVGELNAFALSTEIDRVFSDNVATADCMYPNFIARACADETFTTVREIIFIEMVSGF